MRRNIKGTLNTLKRLIDKGRRIYYISIVNEKDTSSRQNVSRRNKRKEKNMKALSPKLTIPFHSTPGKKDFINFLK